MKCSNANEEDAIPSTVSFNHLPSYLIFHFGRVTYMRNEGRSKSFKDETQIDYPLYNLDLTPFVSKEVQKDSQSFLYDLLAVIFHEGNSQGGHYKACCQDNVDQSVKWFMYNDEEVKEIERPLSGGLVSVLLYARKDPKLHTASDLIPLIQQLKEESSGTK